MRNDDPDIERLLDSALAQYGKVEPRMGLESRVLANLRAERQQMTFRKRWHWWALGLASAAALVAIIWWGALPAQRKTPHEAAKTDQTHSPADLFANNEPQEKRLMRAAESPFAKRPRTLSHAQPQQDHEARRAQFPSPAPLSPQEQLLARYVSQFPDEAARTAQSEAAMRRADELAWNTPPDNGAR